MRARVISFAWCLAAAMLLAGATYAQNPAELRPPAAFASISDQQARSRALFTEAAKVIMNPRCMNCHPASDRPTQGNDMHPHLPQVTRGADGGGVPGNTCGACHMDRNVPIFAGQQTTFQSMPGHSRWGLAPIEMAWEGKSMGEICRQIKDPQRNGGRNLALLHEHLAHDDLVGWAWKPGPGRDPAPDFGISVAKKMDCRVKPGNDSAAPPTTARRLWARHPRLPLPSPPPHRRR
jgi:hypothetical protein